MASIPTEQRTNATLPEEIASSRLRRIRGQISWLRRRLPRRGRFALARALRAWGRALRERNTPLQVALAFGIGTFIGTGPFFPVHGWVALVLATTFRLNRIFTFVGSRVCVFFVFPWILWAEVQSAHWLRTGATTSVDRAHILDHPSSLLGDALLGWIPIGGPLALLSFAIGWTWSTNRQRRLERAQKPKNT